MGLISADNRRSKSDSLSVVLYELRYFDKGLNKIGLYFSLIIFKNPND